MKSKSAKQYVTMSALHSFGSGMIASVYVIFLTKHGLDPLQVNLVNLCFFTTLFISEIPTGAFADIFGRKTSYVVSHFIQAIGAIVYGLSTTFWGFVSAEIILAIGVTFASGAFQAWLVDKIKHEGVHEDEILNVFSKTQMISKVAGMLAAIIGANLSGMSDKFPWFVMSIIFLIHGFIGIFWLKEEYFVRKVFSFKSGLESMKETISHSIEYGIKSKTIRFVLVLGIIQVLAVQAPNMQWQVYMSNFIPDQKYLGYVWTGMSLAMIIGASLAKKLVMKIKDEKKSLIACQVMIGTSLVVTTLLPYPLNILMFMLHEIPRGMYEPLKNKFMHDNIPSHARATISSFESISPHFGGMVGLLCSGILAKGYGISFTWIASGLFIVIASLLFARTKIGANGT